MSQPEQDRNGNPGSLRFRYGLTLLAFLAVVGFLLWEEHKAHILGSLPLLLLLGACVGMHFFMRGGHGREHDDSSKTTDTLNQDDAR